MKKIVVDDGVNIRSENSTEKMMDHLLIALVPIVVFSFVKNGILPTWSGDNNFLDVIYPLLIIIIGIATSIGTEAIYANFFLKINKDKLLDHLKHSYAIFPGLFIGLLMPITMPLHFIALGTFVGVGFGKLLFGGFGRNVLNPALLGYLFLFLMFPMMFTSNQYFNKFEVNTISSATPLTTLKGVDYVGSYNELVEPYGGLSNLFLGFKPGSAAEVSIILCLLALVYLTIFKVIKIKIPLIYVGTVFVLTAAIGFSHNMEMWYPLLSIMSGGLIFGAVFMATDPVTTPVTNIGQIIFAIMLGIITVIFRYLMPYPEGVMFSILIMNCFVFIIDRIGARARLDNHKAIIFILLPIVLAITVGIYISSTLITAGTTAADPNFKVISKTNDSKFVYYTVTQKCFYQVKAKITLDNKGVITDILVLENQETFYSEITKADYINQIIISQHDLTKLDTISGATRTSGGLKKMIDNVLLDYKTNKGA